MAGLPGKPRVIYPRRRFSLRDLLRNELGLGARVARLALARDPPDPALPDAVTGRGRGCPLTTQVA